MLGPGRWVWELLGDWPMFPLMSRGFPGFKEGSDIRFEECLADFRDIIARGVLFLALWMVWKCHYVHLLLGL